MAFPLKTRECPTFARESRVQDRSGIGHFWEFEMAGDRCRVARVIIHVLPNYFPTAIPES